ncbi:MFS transporter [Arcobacter sp. FWKO B]|uniref:MFS transporter n=1 Tax=Arcobacter sp. FWKO B TaxID=2593672 RepID=UPI0018A506E5|nr:MFS transporter [Arcobacter sp. FWKO B]QOG12351.1 MFS transporter [Arcobacter sp. FWKO B]
MIKRFFIDGTLKPVIGLGITSTIGYGTLFYSFTIMSLEFENEFGWSKSFIFGIFSLGLLLGGLISPFIGKKLDKYGAQVVMSIGSFLAALGMLFISFVETKFGFILSLLYIEIVATFVLYEAAFVALSQIAKEKARLPMAQITLIAGFASTIFWPLITFLLEIMSWRDVYLVLSLLHLCIALPLHLFMLKNRTLKSGVTNYIDSKGVFQLTQKQKDKAIVLLAITLCLIAIPIAAIQLHLLSVLQSFGIEAIIAVALGALIGPSQVGARVVEMIFSNKTTPIQSAIISNILIFLSLISLLLSVYEILFATLFVVLYGAGQGLNYIARGSLPLYILSADSFGKNSGILNLFIKITTAISPFSVALLLDFFGNIVTVVFLVIVVMLSFVSLFYLKKVYHV